MDRSRDKLLRLPQVRERTGLSRSTVYRKIEQGAFPPAIHISVGMVAWYESDINAWVADPMGWAREAA